MNLVGYSPFKMIFPLRICNEEIKMNEMKFLKKCWLDLLRRCMAVTNHFTVEPCYSSGLEPNSSIGIAVKKVRLAG
jgi:hypothetical protein